ncbi:hypothetical protein SNEBB_001301 [Seison nebaliae]|nr:hypothetical protein SNEBB_001301 [Seison nebaliae]
MGKGYENYMSKKWFHPTNRGNQERRFLAEKNEAEHIKRQEDLRIQREKEHDMYANQSLMGNEKAKVGLAFMYSAPLSQMNNNEDNNCTNNSSKLEWKRNRPNNDNENDDIQEKTSEKHKNQKRSVLDTNEKITIGNESSLMNVNEFNKRRKVDEIQTSNTPPSTITTTTTSEKKEKEYFYINDVSLEFLTKLPEPIKKRIRKKMKHYLKKNNEIKT